MQQEAPVAVIGAAGFLGRALTRALDEQGTPVAAYTRSVPFRDPGGRPAPGLSAARTIFWLATRINPQIAELEPQSVAADRAAFDDLLRAVQSLDTPPTVVLLSSGGTVYDPDASPPYAEDAATRPTTAYGRAKLALEGRLADGAPGRHLVVRISNAYGPGQPAARGQGVIAHWLLAARRGEHVRLFGDPATTRDYVFEDDVSAALLAVARSTGPLPAALNVGSGRRTSLQELADTVLAVVGDPGLRLVVEPARSFDVSHTWLDVGQAARVLGWRPRTTLPDGIAATWQAVRLRAG